MHTAPSLTDTENGRFLENNGARYELPRDSADLYRRSAYFTAIWGDDFFFVAGKSPLPVPAGNQEFVITDDCQFTLSDKIAHNPRPPQGTEAQETARAAFKVYRDQDSSAFPLVAEIRSQTGSGAGLQLLSGGAFVFVAHDFGDGPETRLALFKRTDAIGLLTDPNGLVAEPNTAQKEALEELTLVQTTPHDQIHTILAIDFAANTFGDDDYLNVKRSQEDVIRANLNKTSAPAGALTWAKANVQEISPVKPTIITVVDQAGKNVDTLSGVVGCELNYNTWVYRRVGLTHIPPGCAISMIDGERFDRPGRLVDAAELRKIIDDKAALSSTAGIGEILLEHWPRPTRALAVAPRGIEPSGAA